MKKIGILGGTFNPIHNGHINLAKKAIKEFKLDTVIFVPTGTPPHKPKDGLATKKQRYQMVNIAVGGIKKFKISKIEIDRKGYSYAIDTFTKLKKQYSSGTEMYYIMGLDSINSILSWKKPIDLFKMCRFIVATRPKTKIRTFKRIMKFPPIAVNKSKIDLIEMNMKISSTDIREKISSGKDARKLLPKGVYEYLTKNKIYFQKEKKEKK